MTAGTGDVWLLDHGEIFGGGQRFGLRLALALRDVGRTVRIGCELRSPLGENCRRVGLDVTDMRFPRPAPWNPAVALAVRRTRRFRARLDPGSTVIGNHPRVHAYLYAAGRGSGGPAIVNVAHERDTAGRRLAGFPYRRFGALVAIGTNAAREYQSRLPGVRVIKANNFLPVSYFEHARGQRVLSPETREPAVGVLARLIPGKGVAELLEELSAPAARPAWGEVVVGGGRQDAAYSRRVERRIEELGLSGRVRLIGEVEDVPRFLSSVDVLVVPSTGKESQPTVIIEALAHGVPVAVREPLHSRDFEGLPVASYGDAAELGKALRAPRSTAAPVQELIERFGPDQAIAGIDQAAELARARS